MTIQTEHDRKWMMQALKLARRGLGLTSPNPAVGCVLLDPAGNLCGEGWHEYEKRDHAEVAALHAADGRARGGTAYVTLEPCNHTGRTGPCSQALIDAGLRRVVIATVDPNAAVASAGLKRMRDAGIEVVVGCQQAAAQRLNEAFARWIQTQLPFVWMKVAMTLDGRIAPAPGRQKPGEPLWITGAESLAEVHRMRHQSDAILTGIETVLADDPMLTDRSASPRRRPLLRVVLDTNLRLPLTSRLVQSAQDDLLVFTLSQDGGRIAELALHGVQVCVLATDAPHVPLHEVLAELGRREILTVMTECGTRLNTALLSGGYVDRLQIFQAPMLLGDQTRPAFAGLQLPMGLAPMETKAFGLDQGMSTLFRDPWPNA